LQAATLRLARSHSRERGEEGGAAGGGRGENENAPRMGDADDVDAPPRAYVADDRQPTEVFSGL